METPPSQFRALLSPPVSTAAAAAYAVFACFFVAGRVGAYGPNHGDVAIWIPMHEWMSRGAVLYESVWDHKDWGFFWLSHPFYRLMGIEGLYLAAFLAVVAFGFGVYLCVRAFTSSRTGSVVASTAALTYTAAPSFWSIFTENLSSGLLVLAIGLSIRTPFVGGLIWALSASVKVAGAGLLVAALATIVISAAISGPSRDRRVLLRQAVRLLAGFTVGAALVVLAALITGSLLGWVDVITYNREYSQSRGFPPSGPISQMPGLVTQAVTEDIRALGQHQFFYVAALVVSILALSSIAFAQRKGRGESLIGQDEPERVTAVSAVVALAALFVTLAQRPSPQHWQYFVGPAVLLISVLFVRVRKHGTSGGTFVRILGVVLLVLPLALSVYFDRSMLPRGILDRGIALTYFAQGGVLGDELRQVPPDSTLSFYGINDERVDVAQLPDSGVLACPLIVQFPWYSPRYDTAIEQCIQNRPDYVVVGTEIWGTDAWQGALSRLLESEYVQCAENEPTRELWVRAGGTCPSGR